MCVPAMFDGVSGDVQLARPLGHGQLFAIPVDDVGAAPILVLREDVGPVAVLRRVSRVVIATFQGFTGGAWTHIREKLAEVIPTGIERQTAPTVIGKLFVFRVKTARSTLRPRAVFLRLVHAVFGVNFREHLTQLTAAGLRAASQMLTPSAIQPAALAAALPPHALGFPRRWVDSAQYGQAAVYGASQVQCGSSHIVHLITVSEETWQ